MNTNNRAKGWITREKLTELVNLRMSTYKIADFLKCSQSTVKHWLKKYGLKTNPQYDCYAKTTEGKIIEGYRICSKCKISKETNSKNFYINKRTKEVHSWCKSCNNSATMDKIRARKQDLVNYKGGKCCVCGYNKYVGALDFHHTDPSIKEFNISQLRTYSFDKLKIEADKCVLLCRNCHAEIHAGLITL